MRYKPLEQALFVGAGRFLVDDGGLKVEYRISKVSKGTGSGGAEALGEAAAGEGSAS